jgi:hypothetical protein
LDVVQEKLAQDEREIQAEIDALQDAKLSWIKTQGGCSSFRR